MKDEPTGRYVVKLDGKPFAARTYHLYKDCGHIAAAMSPNEYPATVIEPSDDLMEILDLRLCQQCEARSKLVAPEDVLATAFGCSAREAEAAIDILSNYGYVIRQERKRIKTDDDDVVT